MEVPMLTSCSTCHRQVELHKLSQCSFCGPKNRVERQQYCLRTCRNCRTKDCITVGHSTCWEWHLPRDPAQHHSHVPLDPVPQLYVDAVTYMESNPEIQRKLHEEDRVARWFTIRSDNQATEGPRLCVTDRFRQLCSSGISDCQSSFKQYPGFVSFIGKTGIGKSTLLRAMILMGQIDPSGTAYRRSNNEEEKRIKIEGLRNILAQKAHGPVTRSSSLDNMTNPTSFGVHLYKDVIALEHRQIMTKEITNYEAGPMLFIDCEGFQAGQRKADAQQIEAKSQKCIPNVASDLPITAESYSKSGKDGVDLFYARFIYAVSDVVVFVMSGDTTFFPSMQKLVEWAEAAVRRSVNHLAQKTLVIVRNMAPLHDKDLYEPSVLKDKLLNDLQDLWEGSPSLTKFRNDFNSKQEQTTQNKIFDNWDLLGKFFSTVEFCDIPDTARAETPDDIFKQYRALRSVIVQASQESQKRRAKAWMQYNVPTLSHILNNAFEHFRTSDLPFDFHKAARNDNPSPTSLSDHVANFIRHVHLTERFSKSENFMADVIAICLVSRVLRTFTSVREPHEIFSTDLEASCKEGIAKFRTRDQQCGYMIKKGSYCISIKATHTHEHCDEKGRRQLGAFDEMGQLNHSFLGEIGTKFVGYYENLCSEARRIFTVPSPVKSKKARQEVLQKYKATWNTTRSNKTCFACLQAVPDHMLECGHAFCAQCVQEFGKKCDYFEYGWVMDQCILCRCSWQDHRHIFRQHPKCAGIRALTLDGGGIRGIVELALLEHVQAAIGLDIPLREYFDIIVGTSTGGIIALGLAGVGNTTASKEMSVQDLKQKFISLATKIFENGKGGLLDPLKLVSKTFMIFRIWDSLYPTDKLKAGLQELFGAKELLFSSAARTVRVAVTSAKDNGAEKCLIANYNRPDLSSSQDFEREDEADKDMKIWEAALATAAAPFYFTKFEKNETGKNYIDGALHANFPVHYALEEISRVWDQPGQQKIPLDILLSVGTGIQKKEIVVPTPLKIGGFEAVCTSFHNNLDSQKRWLEFEEVHLKDSMLRGKVHRLNAPIGGSYVALDHYKRMGQIDKAVKNHLSSPELALLVDGIAGILIASLFFFEPEMGLSGSLSTKDQLVGSIRCRLAKETDNLKNLLGRITGFYHKEVRDAHNISSDENRWVSIPLTDEHVKAVRGQNELLRVNCTLRAPGSKDFHQVLAVSLKPQTKEKFIAPIPISGFPITFQKLLEKAK